MTDIGPVGRAYLGVRQRVTEMVEAADPAALANEVAACPGWTVHDVVAHLSGVVDDALAGRLDGVATDPWTNAQVERGRGRPVGELLEQWAELSADFAGLLDAIGAPGRQAVMDAVTHEHDIRAALDRPGARDSDAVLIGASFIVPGLVQSAHDRGVALRVVASDGSDGGPKVWHPAGADGPDAAATADATVTATAFELLRAASGRRTPDQIRDLAWEGDVDAVLPAFTFGPFRPTATTVEPTAVGA